MMAKGVEHGTFGDARKTHRRADGNPHHGFASLDHIASFYRVAGIVKCSSGSAGAPHLARGAEAPPPGSRVLATLFLRRGFG